MPLLLIHISVNECNSSKDINTNQNTIQIKDEMTHLYDETGKHLITIPITRLKWLWDQYSKAKDSPHGLTPPTQPFETEIIWLYQRYKYRIPKTDPLKLAQYSLPKILLDHIIASFNITHTYFSSPVTCSTQIDKFYSPFKRDKIFGSMGQAFSYKWKGIGYAHPHNKTDTQKAIHWARLAANNNSNTITIITTLDKNWYHNLSPHKGPYPDTHVVTYIPADTITYEEPTKPPEFTKSRIEPSALHILCVHHKNTSVGNNEQITALTTIFNKLQIPQPYIQIAPLTQPNTEVNKSKEWNKLIYPTENSTTNYNTPPIPNFINDKQPKFVSQYCYYTDGSFLPPQDMGDHWTRETAGYGIYNESKNIELAMRLPGLQNIFRAEIMAIYTTLQIIISKYPNEPAHIFTDCLNGLYNIQTQLKHPTQYNNHPDKTILQDIVTLLQQRTQPTSLYKVRAHANIDGNEKADELAKEGRDKDYHNAALPHEFAHSTPYYFQRDWWHSMDETPDKGPIRFLEKHIIKYDKENNLRDIATNFPNINKWISNTDIGDKLSNEFWTNKHVTDSQKTCLLKLRHGQYMGNARKQLFFGRELYPSITCSICDSQDPDTWLHVLLKCTQHHIHALRTKRHNKAVWEIKKLLASSKNSRCYTLMYAGTCNDKPPENTILPWLLPCTCVQQKCQCHT